MVNGVSKDFNEPVLPPEELVEAGEAYLKNIKRIESLNKWDLLIIALRRRFKRTKPRI